jgi:hypothetical protein
MALESLKTALRANMVSLGSVTLTKGEDEYTALKSQTTVDRDLMPTGENDAYSCSFSLIYDDSTALETGDKVTCNGQEYRIKQIVDDSLLVRRKLICEDV